jgi:hypothetical protein
MTVKTRLQDWTRRLQGARDAVKELGDVDRELRAQHAQALKDRSHITSAPPPIEEVLAAMEAVVDAAAARWAEEHGWSFVKNLGPGFRVKTSGELVPERPRLPDYLTHGLNPLGFDDLVGLFPDAMKARLREILAGVEYQPGPATADRARLVREVDERIVSIEREHEQLVEAAAALEPPVTLALLPAVKQRRAAAQAKAQREQAERAAREAAAQRVEAWRREATVRPAGVSSPYMRVDRPSPV